MRKRKNPLARAKKPPLPVAARRAVDPLETFGLASVGLGWLAWGTLEWLGEAFLHGQTAALTLGLGGGIFLLMLGCVLAVVRYADDLAELLREPYGTLVLTLSATAIEASLMLRVMLDGAENPTLLRDTVFAVLMLSLNAMVGLALAGGGWKHREQTFNLRGALSFLHLIVPLSLLLLVMPNYTVSSAGPTLAPHQEAYLGGLCVVVYLLFLFLQTGRHRSYFDHLDEAASAPPHAGRHQPAAHPRKGAALLRATLGLLAALLPVVLLAEFLGVAINFGVEEMHAPVALGGLIIASLGLFPEALGALRSALANRMQRAVNICLGTALSTIGLTVPVMLIVAAHLNMELGLGLDGKDATLLVASLFVSVLTFVSGGANMLQGIVHLMLFLGYVIFILFP